MWERLIIESTLISITVVLLILMVIALWQKLYKAVLSMGVVYIVYIGSILVSPPKTGILMSDTVFNNPVQTNTDRTLKKEFVPEITAVVSNDTIIPEESIQILTGTQPDPVFYIEKNVIDPDSLQPEPERTPEIITTLRPEGKSAVGTEVKVNKVQVGRNIEIRELIGQDSVFGNEVKKLYCLTGIYNLNKQSIISHNWYINNVLRASIPINVKWSHNWRCWTYITIKPGLTGNWKVVIEGPQGAALDSVLFTVVPQDTN